MNPDKQATAHIAAAIRRRVIESDNQGHYAREFAFDEWRQGSLFPQAVCRWIEEIGRAVKH